MKLLKIICTGCLNSFRQPDFHTYHKTLTLPPKTTIAGMLGSAMGLSPNEINERWLKPNKLQVSVVGYSHGRANDLWQIRKYESKQIAAYYRGDADTPYKTAVIVRELLYKNRFILYVKLEKDSELLEVQRKINDPSWALSLGREDEIVKVEKNEIIDLEVTDNLFYSNTALPSDITKDGYDIAVDYLNGPISENLLSKAPTLLKIPVDFIQKDNVREANKYLTFSYISDLPVKPKVDHAGFFDKAEGVSFQIY